MNKQRLAASIERLIESIENGWDSVGTGEAVLLHVGRAYPVGGGRMEDVVPPAKPGSR